MALEKSDALRRELARLLDGNETLHDLSDFGLEAEMLSAFLAGEPIPERLETQLANAIAHYQGLADTIARQEKHQGNQSSSRRDHSADARSPPLEASRENAVASANWPDESEDSTSADPAMDIPPAGVLPEDTRDGLGALASSEISLQGEAEARIVKDNSQTRDGVDRQPSRGASRNRTGPDPVDGESDMLSHSVGKTESALEPSEPPESRGLASQVTRHASRDEMALGVDRQASAVAAFLLSAVGEFCFAILGPWGRGKTYLTQLIAEMLESRHAYRTVWFNAWKYRSTPEVWAHLYQAFSDELTRTGSRTSDGWFRRIAAVLPSSAVKASIAARIGINRHGCLATSLFVLLSLLAVFPTAALLQYALVLASLLGCSLLLYILHVTSSTQRAAETILEKYGKLADHRHQLGAQGIIGDDLRDLLVACLPGSTDSGVLHRAGKLIALVLPPMAATTLLIVGEQYRPEFGTTDRMLLDLVDSPERAHRIQIALAIWWFAYLSALAAIFCLPRTISKVLLVVDDLDRCEPNQMLELIESIKLLLEDPEVQDRVQVVMLMEEELLRNAIEAKFKPFNRGRISSIVNDHFDKLFIAHMRLGKLSARSLQQITDKYISHSQRHALTRMLAELELLQPESREAKQLKADIESYRQHADQQIKTFSSIAASLEATAEVKGNKSSSSGAKPADSVATAVQERWSYSNDERGELVRLMEAIPMQLGKAKARGDEEYLERVCDVGPRHVRMMLFRYQLCRLLLDASNSEWKPSQLVEALRVAWEHKRSGELPDESDWGDTPPELRGVANQVI